MAESYGTLGVARMNNEDRTALIQRLRAHIAMMAPHQRERAGAILLQQSLDALEGPMTGGDERRHVICLCPDCIGRKAEEAQAARLRGHNHGASTATVPSAACIDMRDEGHLCGPDGLLFEPAA